MTIKMTVGMAGTDFSVSVGDVTDRFTEAEEERLIAAGYAEAVQDVTDTETKPVRTRKKGQ